MTTKSKLSKTKRNNQKRNKLVKQGVIKKKPKPNKTKQLPPKTVKKAEVIESEESDDGADMLEMVEHDDLEFIKSAVMNRSYGILNKVKYKGPSKGKKRKLNEEGQLEECYENVEEEVPMKNLLPIKTKKGIIPQQIVDTKNQQEADESENEDSAIEQDEPTEETNESEEEFTHEETGLDLSKPISTAQLLATRNEILRLRKIHIGTLSSGLLENPEEKVLNFKTLLNIMDEGTPEVYITVRKLAVVSLLEVFKDLLPSYQIKPVSSSDGVKLKKDTLRLQKYEESLLLYYKKFLQKLEKYAFVLVKKKGDTKRRSEEEKKLGELAVHAMCDLLVTHPYFNFSQNIAQAIVPFLNHSNKNVREIVKIAVKTVFKEDKKEEITLKILRLVNSYMKNHAHNVNPDVLEVLLVLNLRDVNLDRGKEDDIKQKKLNAKKHKLLQMSKKERKRKKKLEFLEKEMLETKAEESKQVKQQNLTEITKIIFNIYFRILKGSSNTKVLGVCLEGLAKFAHCINLDYYVDIVNVLDKLLQEDWLGYREKLHCIQTVFSILSGQGEALNMDPTRFYSNLYKDLFVTNATKNHEDFLIVIKTLNDALIKRRKKITNKRTIGFVKRLATLSLQLLHHGSLGSLAIIKSIMQLNRSVDILLDLDSSVGDGKFQADLDDPEYANASGSALFEMLILNKHYHPLVKKYAKHIVCGVPTSGDGSLPPEYGKLSAEQIFTDFNMSEMAFNPPVPIPKKVQPKAKVKYHNFIDSSFEDECKNAMKKHLRYNSTFCI